MEWLLKIVEGPMKGAEIALVEGLRVRVGSGEDCDIVLADAALAAEAFALDVRSDAVSFICGEDVKTLVPYEVFEVGSSAFAIGPAEGVWEPLKKAAPIDAAPSPRPEEEHPSSSEATEPSPRPEGDAPRADDHPVAPQTKSRSRGLLVCCCAFVLLLVILAAVWFFWPKIAETCPQAESARLACLEWFGSKSAADARSAKASAVAPAPTLADLARQHNLTLITFTSPTNHYPSSTIRYPLLRGNFARRTERMAVRALALAADPSVKLELTDDESLEAAARELLFVVTEDAMTVTSATNGVVALSGFAPSAASLERTIRALNDDVPGLRDVLTAAVRIGGIPPPKHDEPRQVFAEAPQQAVAASSGEAASRRLNKKSVSRLFPIAGILTTPYKTVVMENGMRVAEGGTIGGAVVGRIEADRIVFRCGTTTFEWKP